MPCFSLLFVVLATLATTEVAALAHKPANELDPASYRSWQLPHARHAHQKRGGEIPLAPEELSRKPISRQWIEHLLNIIRKDRARPTAHARNLFWSSVLFWEAWRVCNGARTGVVAKSVLDDKAEPVLPWTAATTRDERNVMFGEIVAFGMSRLLRHRFRLSVGRVVTNALIDKAMLGYGLNPNDTDTNGSSASAIGNRLGQAIIDFTAKDGACEDADYECTRADGTPFYQPVNSFPLNPYWNGAGAIIDPNRWQSLEIGEFIDQAGIAVNGYPPFVGPQWGFVKPFSLKPDVHGRLKLNGEKRNLAEGAAFDGLYFDPGPLPVLTTGKDEESKLFIANHTVVAKVSGFLDYRDAVVWNQSPSNSTLGSNNYFGRIKGCDLSAEPCANEGTNWDVNPATGQRYPDNFVLRGDYTRVLAEFWADGPQSETPPGHWNTIAFHVVDHPAFEYRWGGVGPLMDPIEFEVKMFLALNGALHDAAIACWGIKKFYDTIRPVNAIRYLAGFGQSSDPKLPGYHPMGLPLIRNHIRIIRQEDVCQDQCGDYTEAVRGWTPGPDSRLRFIAINKTAIRAWDSLSQTCAGVCWYLGHSWKPYQVRSFVTPPFAGYVSGHSTFSRAAADTLTRITGSAFFPGGIGEFVAAKDIFLQFEEGPFRETALQWATYGDAADECSLSRIYGGIHPPMDDVPGRKLGRQVASIAWNRVIELTGALPVGGRHAVRITLKKTPVELFGSEKAAMMWAQLAAMEAHKASCAADDSCNREGVQARLLPRQAGESTLQRTVLLYGAAASADEALLLQFRHDDHVDDVVALDCDYVQCTARIELNFYIFLSTLGVVGCCCVTALVIFVVRRRRRQAVSRV